MEKNKSAKLRTASRLVGYIGIGACLLGTLAYLLMHKIANETLEKLMGKFDIKSLIYVGIAAAAFLVIAIILRIASVAARKNEAYEAEAEAPAEPAEETTVPEAVTAEEPVEDAPVETVDAADDEAARKAEEKAAAIAGGKTFVAYIGRNIPEKQREAMAKVGEFTKKNAKVIVAVAATLAITNLISKRKAEKETTRRRQSFFRSLGC